VEWREKKAGRVKPSYMDADAGWQIQQKLNALPLRGYE
jgi:hypothetical protein